ncbi:MAG: VCBS repeat-containing protein [Vicinamibacterales bacterium]
MSSAPSAAPATFTDITSAAGIRFRHYNGLTGDYLYPEIVGSGAALFDFDNDGDLDLFLVQGTTLRPSDDAAKTLTPWTGAQPPSGRLYRNDLAPGSARLTFTDVTAASGIEARGYGMGVAAGDVDNDGRVDLPSPTLAPTSCG